MMYARPQPGDYAPYFGKYIDQLPDVPILELLEKQPQELTALLSEVSETQAERAYAPGKWNTKQVLGHMTDTERIMLYRALCISRGEQGSLPGFDENAYVAQADYLPEGPKRIAMASAASFAMDAVEQGTWVHQRVGIADKA